MKQKVAALVAERARAFYAEKIGLEPIDERPGGLKYKCGEGYFALFAPTGPPSGEHTQMAWEVDDIDAVMSQLRRRGVVFEDCDFSDLKTSTGSPKSPAIMPLPDSEGNLLAMGSQYSVAKIEVGGLKCGGFNFSEHVWNEKILRARK